MPAVRAADPDTVVVADGFSCRTQITHLAQDRRPLHTAEVLAESLRATTTSPPAQADSPSGKRLTAAAAAVGLGAGVWLASRRIRT